jgi:hypothetical protein
VQGSGDITDADDNVVMTDEYYDSWRNVINADGEAGTTGGA